ncbi:hypothetical protein R3I93_015160 [Phoxinus phoxinus]|uniref:Uncharacterized protein n=1 Tax=Phoxinus phoxinus TaxID=58324 RepID=A0AAN9CKU2_9TELE
MKPCVSGVSRNPPGRASKRKRSSSEEERKTIQSVDLPYNFRYEEIVDNDIRTTVTPADVQISSEQLSVILWSRNVPDHPHHHHPQCRKGNRLQRFISGFKNISSSLMLRIRTRNDDPGPPLQ